MSQLHLNQVRARIFDRFEKVCSELRLESSQKDPDRFLSRSLAALALQKYADISEVDAATAVVDDDKDGGLDGIFYSNTSTTLFIVQSKWKNQSGGGIELGDVLKYCEGIRQLLQSNAE